jgi:5S rRNA maturation endonuclease (ribonuclease M5)
MLNNGLSKEKAIEVLSYLPDRPDYDTWTTAISAIGNSFNNTDALSILLRKFKDEAPNQHAYKLQKRMTNVNFGSLVYLAKSFGYSYTPLKRLEFRRNNDSSYWLDYMNKDTLELYLQKNIIIPVRSITRGNKTINFNKTGFLISIMEQFYKVYQPYEKKFKYSWFYDSKFTPPQIIGFNELKPDLDYVIIVEGVKDYLVAKANGFNVIALDNVNTKISQEMIDSILRKAKKVILCLDNDKVGHDRSAALAKELSIPEVQLDHNLNGFPVKDISDYIKIALKHDPKAIDELKDRFSNTEFVSHSRTDSFFGAPVFDEDIYKDIPDFLKELLKPIKAAHEKQIILISSIVMFGAMLKNVKGFYKDKDVPPNLYLYVIGTPASGKGILTFSKILLDKIHNEIKESSKKNYQGTQYSEKMLFLPANSSSTGFLELLNNNEGVGVLFETEGDTLTNIFKTEYGNYSDMFRKAFHNERLSIYRRTDKTQIEVDNPYLTTVLSGTQRQAQRLIPDAENGLLSRFIYLLVDSEPVMADVFEKSDKTLDELFEEKGEQLYRFYQIIKDKNIHFDLKDGQKEAFRKKLEELHKTTHSSKIQLVRRFGLISFKIMMILSMMRRIDKTKIEEHIICSDEDFKTSMKLFDVLLGHSFIMFNSIPSESNTVTDSYSNLLEMLPKRFTRKEAVGLGQKLSIGRASTDNFLKTSHFKKVSNGIYEKSGFRTLET